MTSDVVMTDSNKVSSVTTTTNNINNQDDILDNDGRPRLSVSKRKAVDDAFEELFGYPYGTVFHIETSTSSSNSKDNNNKRQKRLDRKEEILIQMFGPTSAARLLSTSIRSFRTEEEMKRLELPSIESIQTKTITEVKRFAGQNITIKKNISEYDQQPETTSSGAAAAAATTAAATTNTTAAAATTTTIGSGVVPPSSRSNIDNVLKSIKDGPMKISTVAKTSSDWDTFKVEKGLEDELEKKAQGKDAYLVKKDFLERVDQRKFEKEKDQRNKERSLRQT